MAKKKRISPKNKSDQNPKTQNLPASPQKSLNLFSSFLTIISYIAVFLVLLEMVARIFIWFEFGCNPENIIYKYYPNLRQVENTEHDKNTYDILILGASVIASSWTDGGVQTAMKKVLDAQANRNYRIFNLATPAHTTLDSYYKYKHLMNRKFDMVIIYDSINETRANNCPPQLFKADYSHYDWYEDLNLLDLHKEIKYVAFPYVFHKLGLRIWKWINHVEYVPKIYPKKEWLPYGSDIKTRGSFKNNLKRIIDIANQKGDKVLLMTFAYYVPKDYSYEKFKNNELDYTFLDWSVPIEEWGDPANVVKGINTHNDTIRELALEHKEILYVDQAKLMPHSGNYFRDICHFTQAGSETFVGNFSKIVLDNMSSFSGL